MPIRIRCPNGHMLVCPDNLAGKAGKCPHCQAKFRIPLPEGAATGGDSAASNVSVAVETAPAPSGKSTAVAPPADAPLLRAYDPDQDAAPADDEIVFLCPEGHQLAGPATAAGQAEECPVCKSRFIVPSPDDAAEEEPQSPEVYLSQLLPTAETPKGFSLGGDDEAGARGLGPLFAALWPYRALGCPIELHLGEGRVLVPNGFAIESASLSHAVFTVNEPSGASTLTVIAWSDIERVNVRNLYDLPRGLTVDVPETK
jgi:hypothetical protein